jgi:hypothetical protein
MVVAGQACSRNAPYRIADLSAVWVYGDVTRTRMPLVKVGQPAESVRRSRLTVASASVAYVYPRSTRRPPVKSVRSRKHESLPAARDVRRRELRVSLGERLVVPRPPFSIRAGARCLRRRRRRRLFRATSSWATASTTTSDEGLSPGDASSPARTSSSIRRASCKARKA